MTRIHASLIHLSGSFIAFLGITYLILGVWFPEFFFTIDGGFEGIRILIGVDLVLGPILTFVVFRKGKPGLRFDLSVIVALQVSCLLAGLFVIHKERPTFFVYYDKHFYSMSEGTFEGYGAPVPDPDDFEADKPVKVYVKLPENPAEELSLRSTLYKAQIPLWTFGKLYQPIDEHLDTVIKEGVPEKMLRDRDAEGRLDKWLAEHGGTFEDYAFIPIHARYKDAYLGVRKSTKEMLSVVEVAPPLSSKAREVLDTAK